MVRKRDDRTENAHHQRGMDFAVRIAIRNQPPVLISVELLHVGCDHHRVDFLDINRFNDGTIVEEFGTFGLNIPRV